MNPTDYYRRKTAEIKESDIRKVAALLSEHVGEENSVRLERLAAQMGMGERQVRDMLETLVKAYGLPVGARAGKAGRFIIANESERQAVIADLASRRGELDERISALRLAKLAPTEPVKAEQQPMFDMAQERPAQWWRF